MSNTNWTWNWSFENLLKTLFLFKSCRMASKFFEKFQYNSRTFQKQISNYQEELASCICCFLVVSFGFRLLVFQNSLSLNSNLKFPYILQNSGTFSKHCNNFFKKVYYFRSILRTTTTTKKTTPEQFKNFKNCWPPCLDQFSKQ